MTPYVLSRHARSTRVEVGPRLALSPSTAQTTSDLLEQESDPRFLWMAGAVPGKLSPGLRLYYQLWLPEWELSQLTLSWVTPSCLTFSTASPSSGRSLREGIPEEAGLSPDPSTAK